MRKWWNEVKVTATTSLLTSLQLHLEPCPSYLLLNYYLESVRHWFLEFFKPRL